MRVRTFQETQQQEINRLKKEKRLLVEENVLLRQQIIGLKRRLSEAPQRCMEVLNKNNLIDWQRCVDWYTKLIDGLNKEIKEFGEDSENTDKQSNS